MISYFVHSINPEIHSIIRLNANKITIENIIENENILIDEIGSGIKIINSMSKIKKIMEIMKNWFENLKFNLVIELNPHSTLDLDVLFIRKFCSKDKFNIIKITVIIKVMEKWIIKLILVNEKIFSIKSYQDFGFHF